MAKPTKTEIEKYVKTLDDVIQRLYREVEDTYLQTLHDTLSDEFQIVANMRDVFSAQTEAHLTPLALDGATLPDNQQVLPADVLVGEGTLPEPPRQ